MTDRAERPKRSSSPLPPPAVGGESIELRKSLEAEGAPASSTSPAADRTTDAMPGDPVASSEPLAMQFGDDVASVETGSVSGGGKRRFGDKVFLGMSVGSAGFIIALVVLIAAFLLLKSVPSILDDKVNFLTSTEWSPEPGNLRFGIAPLLWVTVIISLIALLFAVPIAIGVALFITHYAPRRIAKPVAYVVDLLAAIPSIVFGIWGATVLSPKLEPVQRGLSHIPLGLFSSKQANGTIFDGSVVLAVMVLPIITAISRDVFERTPRENIEAALALGATKWEMIRIAVIPYGRPGVVSGSMLGLGRALGETIAVYLILSTVGAPFYFSIFRGGETFASKIANGAAEFNNPKSTGAYIAAGLTLFVLTFLVNSAARAIVNRRKDFR